jgi:hypothetical protein
MKPTTPDYTLGKSNIRCEERGGWVRVYAEPPGPPATELALHLSQALITWFRDHPHLHPVQVSPMVRGGNTAELHCWYGIHTFPVVQGPEPEGLPGEE